MNVITCAMTPNTKRPSKGQMNSETQTLMLKLLPNINTETALKNASINSRLKDNFVGKWPSAWISTRDGPSGKVIIQ